MDLAGEEMTDFAALKKMGVVLKRARYFIECAEKNAAVRLTESAVLRGLLSDTAMSQLSHKQLSFFDRATDPADEIRALLSGR